MKGALFVGDRKVELTEVEDPVPAMGEVVLEIKASGMCGSDLKLYRAPAGAGPKLLGFGADAKPVVAGHEPCGVVAAIGPGVDTKHIRVGMRAMVHHYLGCGACAHCRTGWSQLCQEGIVVYGVTGHGAHAPYMKVAASTLVALPEELSFKAGAAISCGTGTAYGALRRLGLSGNDCIAIFGQGPVGLSAAQLASAMGAKVIALDISDQRLELAKRFGATTLINSAKEDPVAAIKELTRGTGADMTLETSGAPSARAAAVRSCKIWGTACYVGEEGTVTLDVSPDLLRRQMTIIGSWTFSVTGQAECARFVAERGIDVDALFSDEWALSDANAAYQWFDRQNGGKGVFIF